MANRSLHPLLHYLRRLGGSAAEGSLEDAQLLHRFLTVRDESAFTTIVQRYGAMVWGLCVRRLGETPEAEDAFQATFLVLVRKAASLRASQLLGPWLYGVANRTALKLRGKRARQATRETTLPEQLAEERPEQVGVELRPILDEEINRLPTKYRLPVLLCYLQGMSSEEAARQLGCAKGTIFSRLSRARDLLRRRLVRRGLDVSAGALAAVLVENAALRAAPSLALREITIHISLLLAAGTAGQSLSAPLAALVEGVVRSMFLSKVKFAVIILLALGLVGSGAGFLAHHSKAEPPAPKPVPLPAAVADKAKAKGPEAKPKPTADQPAKTPAEITHLLKARVALAQKGYEAAVSLLPQTKRIGNVISPIGKPEEVHKWSVRWLQAQRDLSPKKDDEIAVLEAHLKRMTELQKWVKDRKLLMSPIQEDEVEWYRLEAELWLAEAKAKAAK
ncbi:MAG TPA: RNA polymerase sigma factor [Gemmataceae bacterium]|nr:RNA polymerase sigma factor [Gemmataceae bacterium]